jgi:hypothetical protein
MIERLARECPFCIEYEREHNLEGRVFAAYLDQYHGSPHCTRCGAFLVGGEWFKECATCGERVDELHGLFVLHNCKECQRKVVEADRKAGRVCPNCRRVYAECCC